MMKVKFKLSESLMKIKNQTGDIFKIITIVRLELTKQEGENGTLDKDTFVLEIPEKFLDIQKTYLKAIEAIERDKIIYVNGNQCRGYYKFAAIETPNTISGDSVETQSESQELTVTAVDNFQNYIKYLKKFLDPHYDEHQDDEHQDINLVNHQQNLQELLRRIENHLKSHDVHIVFKIDRSLRDLESLDLQRISDHVRKDNDNLKPKLSFAAEIKSISDLTLYPSSFSIFPIDTLEVLIIYLNQLDDEENWKKHLQDSQKSWVNVDKISHLNVTYLDLPNLDELRDHLKSNKYHVIVVEGHGPDSNSNNRIKLTPNHGSECTISVEDFTNSFKEVKDLQVVCLLACNSDILAKSILQRTGVKLVFACNHLLAISVILDFEKAFYDEFKSRLDTATNQIITWPSILQAILERIKSDREDIPSMSSHSMRIYQAPGEISIFQFKAVEIKEPEPEPPRPEPKTPWFKQLFNRWWIITMVSGLALLGIAVYMYKKQKDLPRKLPEVIYTENPEIIRKTAIYNTSYGGVILNPKKNHSDTYYAITAVDENNKNGGSIKVFTYDEKDIDAKIVDSLEQLQPENNKEWKIVIVSFQSKENRQIAQSCLETSKSATEGETFDIWGYELRDKNRNFNSRQIQVNSKTETNNTTPLEYRSTDQQDIGKEYLMSPIFNKKNCIIGVHIKKDPKSTNYQGQLMSNIQNALKNSQNPELKEIAEKMKNRR